MNQNATKKKQQPIEKIMRIIFLFKKVWNDNITLPMQCVCVLVYLILFWSFFHFCMMVRHSMRYLLDCIIIRVCLKNLPNFGVVIIYLGTFFRFGFLCWSRSQQSHVIISRNYQFLFKYFQWGPCWSNMFAAVACAISVARVYHDFAHKMKVIFRAFISSFSNSCQAVDDSISCFIGMLLCNERPPLEDPPYSNFSLKINNLCDNSDRHSNLVVLPMLMEAMKFLSNKIIHKIFVDSILSRIYLAFKIFSFFCEEMKLFPTIESYYILEWAMHIIGSMWLICVWFYEYVNFMNY